MSSKKVGIEEARKRLGDLVTAVQQGADVILTRNGKPAARLVSYQEDIMTTTTATTYGADFSHDVQADGIMAYINGADYAPDQAERVFEALMSAFRDEVDERLPQDVSWQPRTSEFVHPVGVELPEHEDMTALFAEAWEAVVARYDEIEVKSQA